MTAASPDRRAIITEALRKIDDLTAQLEIAQKGDTEPIAVIGMGCRFPGGADNPAQYWRLLQEGASGIVRVPPERWDADAFSLRRLLCAGEDLQSRGRLPHVVATR